MIHDDSIDAYVAACERVVSNFERLPVAERIERLQRAGILDEHGDLAPRYAGDWDEDEPAASAAK